MSKRPIFGDLGSMQAMTYAFSEAQCPCPLSRYLLIEIAQRAGSDHWVGFDFDVIVQVTMLDAPVVNALLRDLQKVNVIWGIRENTPRWAIRFPDDAGCRNVHSRITGGAQ